MSNIYLKVTIEKPLNPWCISGKTIIEVGNITKAATFKICLHLSYKNT